MIPMAMEPPEVRHTSLRVSFLFPDYLFLPIVLCLIVVLLLVDGPARSFLVAACVLVGFIGPIVGGHNVRWRLTETAIVETNFLGHRRAIDISSVVGFRLRTFVGVSRFGLKRGRDQLSAPVVVEIRLVSGRWRSIAGSATMRESELSSYLDWAVAHRLEVLDERIVRSTSFPRQLLDWVKTKRI